MTDTDIPTLAEFLESWSFLLDERDAPTREEITGVDAYWCAYGDYSETDLAAVLTLTGDRWASLVSWCDTTGYGCQDGTDWRIFATRSEAIGRGLDLESRRHLGLELPGEKINPQEGA